MYFVLYLNQVITNKSVRVTFQIQISLYDWLFVKVFFYKFRYIVYQKSFQIKEIYFIVFDLQLTARHSFYTMPPAKEDWRKSY